MQKRKSVFRLRRRVRIACEPIPWSAQGDPKIKEKTLHISEPTFLIIECKNMLNKGPQKVSKMVTGFPGWRPWGRLGRPLTPQSVFEHKKYAQSAPKMAPRVQKLHQKARRTARSD